MAISFVCDCPDFTCPVKCFGKDQLWFRRKTFISLPNGTRCDLWHISLLFLGWPQKLILYPWTALAFNFHGAFVILILYYERKIVKECLICRWRDKGFRDVEADCHVELVLVLDRWVADFSVLVLPGLVIKFWPICPFPIPVNLTVRSETLIQTKGLVLLKGWSGNILGGRCSDSLVVRWAAVTFNFLGKCYWGWALIC